MAEQLEWPESIKEKFPKLSLRQVTLLQAHIRGFIVRSQMKEVREEFIEVFNELQQNNNLHVYWKSPFLCLPSFMAVKKEEELKRPGVKPIQELESPREANPIESNLAIDKETSTSSCGPRDNIFDNQLFTVSPQSAGKTPDEPINEDEEPNSEIHPINPFPDDQKQENGNLLSEFGNGDKIRLQPVSSECFGRPSRVEQDSESVKASIELDVSLQKNSKATFDKQGHSQAFNTNNVYIQKEKDFHSQDSGNDDEDIYLSKLSSRLKPAEKDDKSEFQNYDSSFTDVTSVWGSDISLSGDSRSETPCPETVASLQLQKQNIALELVWIQQAIHSRKNYLRIKSQLDSS